MLGPGDPTTNKADTDFSLVNVWSVLVSFVGRGGARRADKRK